MGFLLLLPFFLIRFGLMALLDKHAIRRAANFAPMEKDERVALWLYQLSNIALFLYLCFLRIRTLPQGLFYAGMGVYALGSLLLVLAVVGFAAPAQTGINQSGIYALSRNPMYVAYFFVFLGCVLLTHSVVLLVLLLVFQISTHWIIRAEERWCMGQFGEAYLQYMKRVRRYL